MKIGELSIITGVSVRSLRYYDQKNLLKARRSKNGYRLFDQGSIERVRLIQLYLGLGLNTKQIEQILLCKDQNNIPEADDLCDDLLHLYQLRLKEVEMQLNQLSDLKKRLEESIFQSCPVPIPANRTLSLRHDTGHLP